MEAASEAREAASQLKRERREQHQRDHGQQHERQIRPPNTQPSVTIFAAALRLYHAQRWSQPCT